MATSQERQARLRARRRQTGVRRHALWLDPEGQALVTALQQPGEQLEPLLVRALTVLKDVTGHETTGSDALLLAFIRLFFPEDKPVYPRRAYGLRTLPLHALNTCLAGHGYVLHAAKVRNADWFVTCTDKDGHTDVSGLFELRWLEEENDETRLRATDTKVFQAHSASQDTRKRNH